MICLMAPLVVKRINRKLLARLRYLVRTTELKIGVQYAATVGLAGGRRERFHDGLNLISRLSSCSTHVAHRK